MRGKCLVKWWPSPADYLSVWQAMQTFTATRHADTVDEIWLCEHAPVYTLGQAGRPEHILNAGDIPVIYTDRGGQVTYHGPGQVVAYVLLDLHRANLYVKEYVAFLESCVIQVLADYGIVGQRKPKAPGVYVQSANAPLAKIAALGIKVRKGCAYHGVALNVAMDLTPFSGINPCGDKDLTTTDMARCGGKVTLKEAGERLAAYIGNGVGTEKPLPH